MSEIQREKLNQIRYELSDIAQTMYNMHCKGKVKQCTNCPMNDKDDKCMLTTFLNSVINMSQTLREMM